MPANVTLGGAQAPEARPWAAPFLSALHTNSLLLPSTPREHTVSIFFCSSKPFSLSPPRPPWRLLGFREN